MDDDTAVLAVHVPQATGESKLDHHTAPEVRDAFPGITLAAGQQLTSTSRV